MIFLDNCSLALFWYKINGHNTDIPNPHKFYSERIALKVYLTL